MKNLFRRSTLRILFLAVLFGMSAHKPAHAEQNEQNYAFWCRGPLPISAPGSAYRLEFLFKKNATAAGPQGKKLQPGTCAWADRPLSSTEPTRMLSSEANFFSGGDVPALLAMQTLHQRDLSLLQQALMSSKYRVKIMAHTYLGVVIAPASEPGARQIEAYPF